MRQRVVHKTEEVRDTERQPPQERKVLSATEARQGEIILGKYGRWLWIGTFVVALVFLIFGL